jgi:iron complex outermembrane recepter protein
MHSNSIQWSVATAVALGLSMGSGAAIAQSAADDSGDLTEVIVTGSRIRGIEPTGSAVLVVDRDAIVRAGTTTTTDLLRKIPQVVGLGASETASAAQNGAANVTRASGVNLRGIGSNATLLLFDGRRLPPSGTQGQLTDASVVPAIALQRVEVVADGGSAIYGSDAVAGVVNLIPRTTYIGNESAVRFGVADAYDEFQLAHIFGTTWGSGNLVIAGEYGQHTGLDGADRSFYTTDLRARGGSDLRATTCSPGNIVVGGVSYVIPEGSTGVGLTPATVLPGTRRCDNLPRGHILPEVKRGNVFLSGTQEITEQFSLYLQGLYSRREFELRDSGATSNLSVPRTNPFYFNPTGGTGNVTVQYDFANDFGLAVNPGTAESYQGTVGARYKFAQDWQLDAYISYGASDDEVRRTNNLNTTATGINARLAIPDPQLAFNPFGSGSSNSAAVNDAVSNGQFIIQGGTELTVYSVQADGPLFDLPGGAVRLAVGAEYRDEELNSLLQSGSTVAPVVVPGLSTRSVTAVFGELFVPLFGADNAAAGAQRLDLSISGRFEDYTDFGTTTNPKLGLVWAPISSLLVRGSWGTSFRAPGLAENDPRSGGYGLYGDNLPCPIAIPPATTCFGIGIAGGNADLAPEDATTWSVGLEFTPESIAGLRASLTYFDIDYENQIIGLRGAAGLLTNPLYADFRILNPTPTEVSELVTQGLYRGEPLLPGGGPVPINSSVTGNVQYIQDGRRQNLSGAVISGIDAEVGYLFDTSAGTFNVGALASYLTDYTTQLVPGAVKTEVVNTLNFPQELRARGEFGWRRNSLNAALFVNYTGSYVQVNTAPTPNRDISSFTTFDLSIGYDIGEALALGAFSGLSVALNAQNLFDNQPPFVNISGGYDPQSANPIGRLVIASMRMTW